MAMDLLQQFLGKSPQRQQEYADFLRRFQNDPNSISDEEAARRYREMMQNASPEVAAQANQQVFSQLPDQQRQVLASHFQRAHDDPNQAFDGYNHSDPNQAADPQNLGQMAAQAAQQQPDLLGQLVGQNSPLNSTAGKIALAAGAAYVASRVLGGQGKMPDFGNLFGGMGGTSHQRQVGG